jgi:hypothetical protein
MTLTEFITAYTGRTDILYNKSDPTLTNQCVQLVAFYVDQVLNKPVIWADAAKWFSNQDTDYYRVQYMLGLMPPVGSLVVWNSALPNSDGAGHIAIMVSGNPNTFTSFDSNWNGKAAKLVTHSYAYVAGWLLPTGGKGAGFDITKQGDAPIMITDTDAEFWRWQKTGMYIRGRMLSRDEFRKSAVGLAWLKALEVLDDSPETDAVQHAQEIGQAALKDDWQGQIAALQNQLKAAQSGTTVTPDDVSWLQKFLAKFGGKS